MNQTADSRVTAEVAHEWHNGPLLFCRMSAEAWLGNIDSRSEGVTAAATTLDASRQ